MNNRRQHFCYCPLFLRLAGPLTVLMLFPLCYVNAQTCEEDISLNSQMEVNDFSNSHLGCSIIDGSLKITDGDGDPVTDLSPLSNIEKIMGNLEITALSSLSTLNGLQSLSNVEGFLVIEENAGLESLEGLDGIENISRGLHILKNPVLETLRGLGKLESVGSPGYSNQYMAEGLLVEDNDMLISLEGLETLRQAEGVTISNNELLSDLSGLETLQTIGEGEIPYYLGFDRYGMMIINNPSLISLNGIQGVTEIKGSLFIESNQKLKSLVGLDNMKGLGRGLHIQDNLVLENVDELIQIETIGSSFVGFDIFDQALYVAIEINNNQALNNLEGLSNSMNTSEKSRIGLRIAENPSLTSLKGLDNHSYPGAFNNFRITDNSRLGDCSVLSICEIANEDWFRRYMIDIHGNANGCNSPEEVKISCSPTNVEPDELNSIVIFPNPADNAFSLSAGNITILGVEIYDINGINILSIQEANRYEYDISFLRRGVYLVKIRTNSGITQRSIIKN